MNFQYFNPVKIIFESECVIKNSAIFSQCGKKAMLVTGRHSAKACGAYEDVANALGKEGIPFCVFDQIENNPSMESVTMASELAKAEQVDFVIGIGGGSPLDAAKAIAVLTANQEMAVEDLFANSFTKALPIIAIPTTSGTGSEATPYSVLLNKKKETKLSFGNTYTYPKFALLDAKYTYGLNDNITISTAVDAFTHVFEGYLAKRSTEMSDVLAAKGIQLFGECLPYLLDKNFTENVREKLLYVSLLGGMVIANTGVTIAHGMGYCYTYFHDIPHGKANGLLMKVYLPYNYMAAAGKIDTAMEWLGCKDIDDFNDKLEQLLGKAPVLSEADVEKYTELTLLQQGSIKNNPRTLEREDLVALWSAMMIS